MYYLVYLPLYLFSLLPLRVLYVLSDLLWFLAYRVFGYRLSVVRANLQTAFPDKSEAAREAIAREFYRNFTDTIVETIKFFSWPYARFEKHFECDLSGLERAYACGKPIYLIAMHNFNWEFANWGLCKKMKYPFLGIYMPLANDALNKIMLNMRARHGTVMLPATRFKESYAPYRNKPHILATVADQSPGNPGNAFWLNFFGKPTPFVKGTEKGIRALDAAAVFTHFYKIRRGHYRIETEFISSDLNAYREGELTLKYVAYIEKCLRERPANYLWSHRRWKHAWKPEYGPLLQP